MVHRKILKRRLCNMSLKKAGDIYKSMTVLHAKRKFHCYKDAFKYLLALAYENASHISSLQLNNRALAKAIQKEKENTALQLKERLSTESLYLDLLREYGILKTKLSSFEHNLIQIDESVKTSMIPNLVRLSDDITTLKMNCDVLKSAVGTTYEPDTTTRIYSKNNPTERNPRIISDAGIPSPVVEEVEEETIQLTERKCKGGLRNVFNISNIKDRRRLNRSLMLATNHESSFTELNSNFIEGRISSVPSEVDRESHGPSEAESKSDVSFNVESTHIIPNSPAIIILSPRPAPYSPAVVLRRVLTPVNSSNLNDSVHSTTVISFKDKSPSINTDDDNSRILPKSERKRSTHSSYFGQCEESSNHSILTERKKSKQSYFFKKNDENKQNKKSESFKTSSHILNVSSMNENNHDNQNEKALPKRSKSRRKSSFRENDPPSDNFSLIGERKRYRTRSSSRSSLLQCDEEISNQSTLKAEIRESMPVNSTFGNETNSENSFNDSRRLRTRSKNVCYKERPLNVKLRN